MLLSLNHAVLRLEEKLKEINFPDEPSLLYDPVRYILSIGGKRIRPALLILSANVFTEDIEASLEPAIGIEIFHNFTLLHDDLMDNSKMRRGKETVHLKWNPNIAILSGDAMSIIANRFISKVKPDILPEVLDTFNKTAVEVCEGQMMDMAFEKRNDVSVPEYIRMIELKTSVLIAASLKIGALIGGAGLTRAQEMYQFGLQLGIAFQLQDDLLDTYGDTEKFGKKVGNDILTNKKTFLMISAIEKADSQDLHTLRSWLEKKDFDPSEKIRDVKNIFNKYDIRNLTQNRIKLFFDNALTALEKIDIEAGRKKVLTDFSNQLMKRDM